MVEKPINIKTLIMPLDETIVMMYANMEQVNHNITIENFNSEDDFSPIQLIKVGINKIHSIFFTEELPAIAIDNKVVLKSDELNDNKMLIVEKISDTKFKTMQHPTLKAPPGACMLQNRQPFYRTDNSEVKTEKDSKVLYYPKELQINFPNKIQVLQAELKDLS